MRRSRTCKSCSRGERGSTHSSLVSARGSANEEAEMCAPVRGARGDIEERVDLDVDGGPGAGRCAGETGSQGKDAGDSFVAAADIAANSGVFTMSEQRKMLLDLRWSRGECRYSSSQRRFGHLQQLAHPPPKYEDTYHAQLQTSPPRRQSGASEPSNTRTDVKRPQQQQTATTKTTSKRALVLSHHRA